MEAPKKKFFVCDIFHTLHQNCTDNYRLRSFGGIGVQVGRKEMFHGRVMARELHSRMICGMRFAFKT